MSPKQRSMFVLTTAPPMDRRICSLHHYLVYPLPFDLLNVSAYVDNNIVSGDVADAGPQN